MLSWGCHWFSYTPIVLRSGCWYAGPLFLRVCDENVLGMLVLRGAMDCCPDPSSTRHDVSNNPIRGCHWDSNHRVCLRMGFFGRSVVSAGHMLCWAWDNDSDAMGLRSFRFNARAVSGNSFDCWISETVRPHPCNCTLEGIGGLYLVVPFPIEIPLIVVGIPHRDTPVWDTHTRMLP